MGCTFKMYGCAYSVEHAMASRRNSQCRYTFPSGETISAGGVPNGAARSTAAIALMSKAVTPLVRVTPRRTKRVLRRHVPLFEFLLRAVYSWERWAKLSTPARATETLRANELWARAF